MIILECTVNGGPRDASVWKGTVFSDCKHNIKEITLFHHRFVGEITNMSAECNTGHISSIIARSVRVENSSYISQLEVIIKPGHDDNNNIMPLKNVTCAHDNGKTEIDIGSITVNITNICMPSKINDSAIEFIHTTTMKGNQMHCHCM